jgi:hypothetical protein
MAAQAILSSVEAGRQLLCSRPFRSISGTRRASFVVRAASTPPAKVQHFLQVLFGSSNVYILQLVDVSTVCYQYPMLC